ncbi:PREDICTED: deoxyuridine 5'-triphosphate nucleotidohydrolase-like [Ipomoea nil]|uniref:deoxyuridine 5'-triphosphate nucleotidohydrolase-like n=1 Tax=Ipomoea nil TaxID=35883 RepID=UPI000900B757|nr:PREDICTED: deoxyuridine 5'-triphosphate nucleotidohydrolase-like [Ipomoea nil]
MAGVILAPHGFLGQNRPAYSPPFSISSQSSHSHSNSQLHALTVSAMAGNLSSSSPDNKASAPSKFVSGAPHFLVKKLSENAVLPSRGSPLSAGYDLSSAAETKVPARGKALIPTDLSIAVPEGTYARIAPRSGLAWKHSIDVGAGVIDADYRGAVGVILFNHSDVDFEVKVGDRIAQLIIQNIVTPEVEEVDDLDSTVRGSGGFGSTGV